jgi:serine/threonine protein kinase
MGATAAVHSTDETLRSYHLGTLDLASTESAGKHLEGCDTCQRRLAEMASGDPLLGRLRHAHVQPGSTGPVVSSIAGLSMLEDGAGIKAPPPTDTLPPGLADHPDYDVIRELGQGGMGTVYLAKNRLMGRHEVLKVVSRHMMNRPSALDRFLVEIRNAARLHHANIVTAYSATRIGESIVFAMEYVEGLDLSKLVKAKGPLPVSNASNYVHQAALGLEHASEFGMVHRDIKPSNLMLAKSGNRGVIKLLDFGLAKVKSEGADDGGLTHQGQMLGTPDYVAPEQISDARRADIRADIYSLGCTLYYLLTGGPPFQATSLYEILQAHHSMDALPLNLARPEVPVELAALVARMMAKEPERRFQTPKDVAKALLPFFRKGIVGITASKAEMSQPGGADEYRASTRMLSVLTQPAPGTTTPVAPPHWMPSATPRTEPELVCRIEPTQNKFLKKPAYAVAGSARPPGWIRPSVAVGCLLLALFVAWALIVRVKTPNGVIELVNLPKDAEVFVDGEEVAVTWPGGVKPAVISVTAGTHKVSVKTNGLVLSSDEVTVRAEGKEEFIVRLAPLAAAPAKKGEADDRRARSETEGRILSEGSVELRPEAVDKRGEPGGATTPPVVNRAIPPTGQHLKPAEKMSSPSIHVVHVDEFNNLRTGLPKDINIPHDPNHGQSDGVYFVYSPGGWHGWNIHEIRSDGTCEVVARVLSDHPTREAAWFVTVSSKSAAQGFRGFFIKINVRGELFLEPSPWKKAEDFRQVDPRMGPIIHPAIRAGNVFNKLLLVMRKREVVIFVNGVQVYAPLKFDYDVMPSVLSFGAVGPGKKRAEFERVEIHEMTQPKDAPER